MMADSSALNPGNLPEAIAVARRRRLPQLIWLVPLIAVLIGGWLLVHTLASRGPTVVIRFMTAEGIEPGKTRIRYKDVDLGEVTNVSLAEDRSHVLVTAQLVAQAGSSLAADTRFWIVRPRVSGGKVSGIGTLLSGAYIGVDIGNSSESSHNFVGLEVAPILTTGLPGRHFSLKAKDISSLDVGSPVFFRHIEVGEVVAHELNPDGSSITVKVFVHAPYDRYVTDRARFWNASGVDLSLDANGMRLQSQSLASLLLGGIAFEAPNGDQQGAPAPADSTFTLFADRVQATKAPDGEPMLMTMTFYDSIRGLAPGAPVDFRGVVVGEVLSVGMEYEAGREWFEIPVRVAIYPERISLRGSKERETASIRRGLQKAANERGLRAQMRSGNLVTGQLYVALDFFPDQPKLKLNWNKPPLTMPTVRGNLEELQTTLARVLAKIDKLPIEAIGEDLRKVLAATEKSLASIDRLAQRVDSEVAPELTTGVRDLRSTLATLERVLAVDSPLQQDVHDALRELTRAAQSFRMLGDTLERQPESILRGKKEVSP
jgi:paraquat-inducible protein B